MFRFLTDETINAVRRDFPGWDVHALKAEFDIWMFRHPGPNVGTSGTGLSARAGGGFARRGVSRSRRKSLRAQAFAATSGFRERDHRDIRNAEGFESVPLKLACGQGM
jgi:hypothetical protein